MSSECDASRPGGTVVLAGTEVARVGFGMGELTRSTALSADRYPNAVRLIERAFELGIRHFDSAHIYGDGLGNGILAQAMKSVRSEIVIATKVGVLSAPDEPFAFRLAQKPSDLRTAVEDNLTTLETDCLDVAYLRRFDKTPGPMATGDQVVPLDDQLETMIALREEGKIREIGLSHVSLGHLQSSISAGIGSVQNIYNVIDRTDEQLLELCEENNVLWIPFFPRGMLAAEPARRSTSESMLRAIASDLGATPSQVALAWQLKRSAVTVVIPGTTRIEHLVENSEASRLDLSSHVMARLSAIVER